MDSKRAPLSGIVCWQLFIRDLAEMSSNPPFSENAQAILNEACALALSKKHTYIGTEHLAHALCFSSNRAVVWVAGKAYPASQDSLKELRNSITTYFNSRPNLLRAADTVADSNPVYTDAMNRVVEIARQIGSGPVRDGSVVFTGGLIASEFLLAALFIEGTGIGADIFSRISKGAVNTDAITRIIHLNPATILRPDLSGGLWQEKAVPDVSSPAMAGRAVEKRSSWFPDSTVAELRESIPAAPTPRCNWLIPGKLIIGEHPTNADAKALVAAGVDTFVSLIGEYTFEGYCRKMYPASVPPSEAEPPQCMHYLHYPVRDFGAVPPESLKRLVVELKRRILEGHTVYVHCRGGHGRTGMVVIPLLSALYDAPAQEAQQYVLYSTGCTRQVDTEYPQYLHMPETDEQKDAAWAVEALLRTAGR